jgi:hypothetical protein
MGEKSGEPVRIDDVRPTGPHLSPPTTSGPASVPDLPPPPAQLVAALTEFETSAPESFKAVTAPESALPKTTAPTAGTQLVDAQARSKLRLASIVAGVRIVMGRVWTFFSGKKAAVPRAP